MASITIMRCSILSLLVVVNTPLTLGFIQNPFKPNFAVKTDLEEITKGINQKLLNLRFDIGSDGGPIFSIKDIQLELHSDKADYKHPAMPGENGPHPNLSSGARKLNMIEHGHFISMSGKQQVQTLNGAWEVCWKKDRPAGTLICGFDVPQEYKRNEASISKGRVYACFPIWTRDGLAHAQSEKLRVEAIIEGYNKDRSDSLAKMKETNNPIEKALHFRNAFAAYENITMQPIQSLKVVPSNDDTMELTDGIFLTTKGLIWTKENGKNFFGGDHGLLGAAFVTPTAEDKSKVLRP